MELTERKERKSENSAVNGRKHREKTKRKLKRDRKML